MTCARRKGCTNPPGEPCLVCPYARACPTCGQPPGSGCRRPSGHDCKIHIARVLIADAVAMREHPARVLAHLGGRAVSEWQARLANEAPGDETSGERCAAGEQLVLVATTATAEAARQADRQSQPARATLIPERRKARDDRQANR